MGIGPPIGGIFRRFLGSAVSNAAGYGVGGAILPTLEPLTRDLANTTWAAHSVMPLPLAAAAQAAFRGHMADAAAEREASYTGFDQTRFEIARRLHGSPPPLETLLALRRRGVIDPDELGVGLRQAGILPEWRDRLRGLVNVLPSVTDMVRFAVREVYDPAQRARLDLDAEFPAAFAQDAEKIGLTDTRAGQYWAAHWELPSYEQLAEMLFRTDLGEQGFRDALRAIDYAPVWRDRLMQIARRIPTVPDFTRLAVREVYNPQQRAQLGLDAEFPDAFAEKVALHGMVRSDAEDLWAGHWRLPSARQGFDMRARNVITDVELNGLLKALDYPPLWRPRLFAISRIVPGRIDLKRMLRHEIIDRAQVKAGYMRLRYSEEDAERMTRIALAEIDTAVDESGLVGKARSRLYTVAHNEYLDHSLDEQAARTLLARAGALPGETGTIIAIWNAEREISRLELTPAQVKKAFKSKLYDEPTALAELVERGLTPEDAATYLQS